MEYLLGYLGAGLESGERRVGENGRRAEGRRDLVFLFDSSSSLLLVEEGSNERDGSIAREEE
jgi:hypothetical protein